MIEGLALGSAKPPARGAPDAIPGLQGARVKFAMTQAGGNANLSITDGSLTFPGVFEEPRIPLQSLSATVNWKIDGEQIAVDALLAMLTQAQSEGLTSWQISAGYRSVAYQQKLFDDKVYSYRQQGMTGAQARSAARKLVAEPGCSEHHTGLAFDITVPGTSFGGTKQAKWLEEHCWEWGFILRYPADKTAITGITNEPWHFRYVGVDASMEMRETGECLEEYVERKQSEQQ